MKRSISRNREFSNTRLSYSRHRIDQSKSQTNISPSNSRNQDSRSLLCNNCFNRQLSTDKRVARRNRPEKQQSQINTTWTFYENADNDKNRQVYREQLKKINEYNVRKIRQNQLKHELEKQQVSHNVLTERSAQLDAINVKQKGEEIRKKLKEDLEKQIAMAKERRAQTRKEQMELPTGNFIQQKPQQFKKEQLQQQYKKTLMQQIREQQSRKQRQTQSRKNISDKQNQLAFVRQANERRLLLEKAQHENKEKVMAELRKRKEEQDLKKNNKFKAKEEQNRLRLEEERRLKEENRKNDDLRRANIENYLQDLRQQIQQNQINRREEFNRIHTENAESSAIIPAPRPSACSRKMQNCSCCTKTFPKQYLSPYSRMQA